MTITPAAIITALLALILGLSLTAWLFSDKDSTWAKRIGISLLAASLGWLLARTTETWQESTRSYAACTNVASQVESMRVSVDRLHIYLNGISESRRLAQSPFRVLVEREMEDLDDRLTQIARGELRLKREEIIPRWETLIRASKKTIYATNIVTEKDWREFSPNSGIEVQQEALKAGVMIRRIMIYDEKDADHESGLKRLSEPQTKLGIQLRKISIQWIQQSSFLSELMRDLGTVDVVIYDDQTVLLTTVDDQKRMLSARVGTSVHLLNKVEEFFNKLWASSEPIAL